MITNCSYSHNIDLSINIINTKVKDQYQRDEIDTFVGVFLQGA